MLRYCLCMLAGAYSLVLVDRLPSTAYLTSIAAIALICLLTKPGRMLGFLLSGLSLHWLAALQTLDDYLPANLESQDIRGVFRVEDFPQSRGGAIRFVATSVSSEILPDRVRLSWYDAPATPSIGELWSLQVRLRRPRGYANPYGFDYEQWLFRQRIGASGYVVASDENLRLRDMPGDKTTRYRQYVVDRVSQLLPADDATAVLMAIVVGARHQISRQQWDRYAATGTSHLMAISGLHIGLAAAGVYFLTWIVAAAVCRSANLRDIALAVAVLAAAAYAQLSGFAVPAQRAMLMFLLAAVATLCRRRIDPPRVFALVCIVTVVCDPLAIHLPGFQLSFAAVALLLWASRTLHNLNHVTGNPVADVLIRVVRNLYGLQILLLLGLFPLVAALFGRVAWLAVPVNLLVLPVFNLVTVPAAFLGMLFDGLASPIGDRFLGLAHLSLRPVMTLLEALGEWPASRVQLTGLSTAMTVTTLLVAAGALLPRRWPGRRIAWIALASVILYRPERPPFGCFDVHILDVGQGLGVVLETENHSVVYDTGPAFRSGGDTGQLVLVPFLRKRGIRRVDALIVSHADLDHAGGVQSLLHGLEVPRVLAGEPLDGIAAVPCAAGQGWQWDGVRFSILHPATRGGADGNDASCVLSVSAGQRRALFTGDIGSQVERALLTRAALDNHYLVTVPHHGSRTSSTGAFVNAVGAQLAVVASGYRNRWGLPRDDVAQRWRDSGARLLTTAGSGAISQRLCRQGALEHFREERRRQARFWRQ